MKTSIYLFITFILLSYNISDSKEMMAGKNPSQEGFINVFTTPDLYNLTMKWVSEYRSLNPTLTINVIKSEDYQAAGLLNTGGGIGFVADELWVARNDQSGWNMVVGRDIIVPIMNAKNPFRDEIVKRGITPEGLALILQKSENKNWGMLVGNPQNIKDIPLHYYIGNDQSVLSGVENFLSTNSLSREGIAMTSGEEMISAIQKDPDALGFCKLIQIMDVNNQKMAENIQLVPIDKNGNGKIDYVENIYDNLQVFSRGVWIGKYPKALSGKIYAVSSEKPKSETELTFLNWVLTGGQKFLSTNGYSDLVLNERQSQLAKIEHVIYSSSPVKETHVLLKMLLIVLLAFGVIVFARNLLVRRIRTQKCGISNSDTGFVPVFDENSVIIPKGLYFDITHTWAFMKRDGTVKIGIDDFLQRITGSITRIVMKKSGAKIKKGDHLLTIIQKGKQLDIYSPVSGIIKAQNESVSDNPSLLNTSPYEDGWIYTIEPTNWLLEIQFLSMAEKYKTGLENEFTRLKDFLATAIKSHKQELALIALQDGGTLKDSILADFGPEVWDDFQTKFIDTAK